jgi:hypothetical protein
MPPATDAIAITLAVEAAEGVERWVRTFGEQPLHTLQWRRDAWLVEGLGLVQCWFQLRAEGGALIFEQVRATIGSRGFAVPLPRWLSPRIEGRAEPRGDDAHVDVRIHAPLAGLLVAYDGHVTPTTMSEERS